MTESSAASVAACVRVLIGAHTHAQDAVRADDVAARTPGEARTVNDVVFLQRGKTGWTVQVVGHFHDTLHRIHGARRLQRGITPFQA
ncbi:hypothetical protein [Streptomyces sp. NPDC060035]|uniref:hypothetical protein n=1 Tax=Streptomyces sp. NPDC060035 TaxID=3347044 RepID=UPI00369C1D0A